MKPNTSKKAVIVRRARATSFGIQDGVAGGYIAPRYIDIPSIDYNQGAKQYFESTARHLSKSVADYKKELKYTHG